ncbi:MAG: response regulator receiver protein, partial [Clostridiales bacterium]|nr:response regulator receiver protein [Clostridiales bacterium]
MESALIISNSEKSVTFYTEMLTNLLCTEIISVASCGEARRLIIEKDFDICVIHAPLPDESGEGLSRFIAGKGISRVVLSVRSVYFEEISSHVEDLGVVTVSRPINVGLFWNTLKMVKAAHASIRAVRTENFRLHNK